MDKEFIGTINYGAIWNNNQQKHRLLFSKTSLKLAVNYLLNNCYFTLSSTCFRQLIAIPMDSEPSTFGVNFFLYYFKRKWFL